MGLTFNFVAGDQVSKKGGMTGGFYDYRRSRLKFMNIIRQNTKSINMKEEELKNIKEELQNILFAHKTVVPLVLSSRGGSTTAYLVKYIFDNVFQSGLDLPVHLNAPRTGLYYIY